jgi:hypothetical protein
MMAGETKTEDSEKQREINLLDLFIVLLKYKWMILAFVLVAAILAFAYVKIFSKQSAAINLHAQPELIFYYSECLIEPDLGMKEKIIMLLPRLNFVLKVVEDNHLLNDIQQAILNEKKKAEIEAEKPSAQEVHNWLKRNLFRTATGGLLAIGLTSREKDLPPKIINAFLTSISQYFRARDLAVITKRASLLRRQLAASHDSFLKDRIAMEITNLIDMKTRAESRKYYGFEVVDSPSTVEKVVVNLKGNEKKVIPLENVSVFPQTSPSRRPRYSMIILFFILASLVLGITLAFFIEYIRNIKRQDPEKFAILKGYLSFRSK